MAALATDDPYPVLGTSDTVLYGRSKELANILRHLEKRTPDHVSVVGPRYVGKTTLAKHIAGLFAGGRPPFDACVYWNTRWIKDDISFRREFGRAAFDVIRAVSPAAAKALEGYGGESFDLLQLAFEQLREDQKRVLVILDGFDEVLLSAGVTANNWDNMRLLGEMPSIRFLTFTRRRLVDLCARAESRQSQFFNLFAPPVFLGPLSEADIKDLIAPLIEKRVTFEAGVEKELYNFSGGVPLIASYMCKLLWEGHGAGSMITRDQTFDAAKRMSESGKDVLKALWKDCEEDERADFLDLMAERITKASEIPPDRRDSLSLRGYIWVSGDKVETRCRVIEQYARDHGADSSGLRRLFGDRIAFDTNIQSLLQLRFATLKACDASICSYIRLAIQEIEKPEVVLHQVRAVAERALDLWLDKELHDRKIPVEWSGGWKDYDRDGNPPEKNPPSGNVTPKRGGQCYLLRLVADPRKSGKTRIRQSTALLIDGLHNVGDFGQHREGEVPGIMFGASICLTLIQLAEQLTEDLAKPAP